MVKLKKIEKFLDSLTNKDDVKSNWLIDREYEWRLNGYSVKESKEKALIDWDLYHNNK